MSSTFDSNSTSEDSFEDANRSLSLEQPSCPDRRQFLKQTAAGVLVGSLLGLGGMVDGTEGPAFQSQWPADVERHWLRPAYWTNPLQDWRVANGRVEMIGSGPDRNVQHLTRQVQAGGGTFDLRVETGYVAAGQGRAGFEVGIQGPLEEYRNNAIHGSGLKAGRTTDNRQGPPYSDFAFGKHNEL